MDNKLEALAIRFQENFSRNITNMNFTTDEELTLGQRSAVLTLGLQALQEAILEIQPSHVQLHTVTDL